MSYIYTLDKTFIFEPGQGAAYSSDAYVLMGLVLAASTGAHSWDEFDQLKAIGNSFNETVFMQVNLFY
jgi:CubicO group peptidase (beta-lactamase class C family)